MGAILQERFPELHNQITEGNLRRQFDLLRDMVSVGVKIPFLVTIQLIDSLHAHATIHLVDKPGRWRDEVVYITNSTHSPPPHEDVKKHMLDLVLALHQKWQQAEMNTFELAAFALWRLCWIHPYQDGNGRTARAVTYLIICLRHKRWLPGQETLLSKIKIHYEEYLSALRHADLTASTGIVDLTPLSLLLAKHTKEQLKSN
jgi:Fic family protein